MNFVSNERDSIVKALGELGMFGELKEFQSGWNAETTRGREG